MSILFYKKFYDNKNSTNCSLFWAVILPSTNKSAIAPFFSTNSWIRSSIVFLHIKNIIFIFSFVPILCALSSACSRFARVQGSSKNIT